MDLDTTVKEKSQITVCPQESSEGFSMSDQASEIPCTCVDESVCGDCSLEDLLNCRYDEELVMCFRKRHLPYRALALLTVGIASLVTNVWWMFLAYAVVTLLNFTLVESWYLCRHCPFYAKEGSTLHCITLKGMPRLWRYDPAPLNRTDRMAMLLVGGFIDLFPVVAGAYAAWALFTVGADTVLVAAIAAMTILMLDVSVYIGRFLADNYCVKCVNFSCVMSKTPKAVADEYLQRNPFMREIWEACGYVLGND